MRRVEFLPKKPVILYLFYIFLAINYLSAYELSEIEIKIINSEHNSQNSLWDIYRNNEIKDIIINDLYKKYVNIGILSEGYNTCMLIAKNSSINELKIGISNYYKINDDNIIENMMLKLVHFVNIIYISKNFKYSEIFIKLDLILQNIFEFMNDNKSFVNNRYFMDIITYIKMLQETIQVVMDETLYKQYEQ